VPGTKYTSEIVAPAFGKATTARWQYSSWRALHTVNVNQTPLKDRSGLHSALILVTGGLRPPEM